MFDYATLIQATHRENQQISPCAQKYIKTGGVGSRGQKTELVVSQDGAALSIAPAINYF